MRFRLRSVSSVLVGVVVLTATARAAYAHPGHVGPEVAGFDDYARAHGMTASNQTSQERLASTDPETRFALTATSAATPRAACGPRSQPEAAAQGRVPTTDYASGRAAAGYTCNTERVGQFGQTGGFAVHRYVDRAGRECAFYDSTLFVPRDVPVGAQPGVYVLDMSDPARPVQTTILRTPAMQSPHESLRLNAERGLLVANMGHFTTAPGFVDVYDVSADCRFPQLRSSVPLAGLGHEGGFSPDGRTYWATTTAAPGITAIDVSNPAAPSIVWRTQDYAVHGLSVSADGTRVYLAEVGDFVTTTTKGAGGLVVLDVTEVQQRVPNPKVREISRLTWPEVSIPQNSLPVEIGGRNYLVQFDEFDSNVLVGNDPADLVGGVHIIDIGDERNPRIASRIRLEVHQQEARAGEQRNDTGHSGGAQTYAAHYCSVPRYADPGILACTMILSGLRVFDIRDPERPREIAYFNAPVVESTDPSRVGAYAMSAPAFAPERSEIWYSDSNAGFFSVRLTGSARGLLAASSDGGAAVAADTRTPRAAAAGRGAALPATGTTAPIGAALALAAAGALGASVRRRAASPRRARPS